MNKHPYISSRCLTAAVVLMLFNVPVHYAAPEEPAAQLEKAYEYIETGKPDSASVLLYDLADRFEDINNRVRALYYLSLAMDQLGRLGEEIQYLIMAREESPDAEIADRVNLAYSRILYNTGNFEDCISIAEKFRTRYSDSPLMPDMLFIAGNAYYVTGRYQRAFNTFNEITKNYEGTRRAVEALMKAGLCLYKLDLVGGAIERLELYLSMTSDGENVPDALNYLGLCYENTRQPDRAIEMYTRLSINYPNYHGIMDLYFKLGSLYLDTDRFAEAENAFLNYIANTDTMDSNHYNALLNLERIAFRRGRYMSEIEMYENYTIKYPESSLTPVMLLNLAKFYAVAGHTDDALEKYRILMANPSYTAYEDSAAFLTAETYSSVNMKSEAVEFLEKIARMTSDGEKKQRYMLKIGSLHEQWEQYELAISLYDSCYSLRASDNLSVRALMGIGRVFRKLDRWMDAEKIYERILTEYPKNPYSKDVYLTLSDIYYLEGRLKTAALTAEKAVKFANETDKGRILIRIADLYAEIDEAHALRLYTMIFTNNRNASTDISEALLKYGDLALRIGDKKSAIKAYATIIENGIDSVWVNRAREKLDFVKTTGNASSDGRKN